MSIQPTPVSCATCPSAKALQFAVYCKKDADLRNLPGSLGHVLTPPFVQAVPPEWCPLLTVAPPRNGLIRYAIVFSCALGFCLLTKYALASLLFAGK